MKTEPTIKTQRLILRPYRLSDAPAVAELAGDFAIADTTLSMPHPYDEEMALTWITHKLDPDKAALDPEETFAIEREADQLLLGAIGLRVEQFNRADVGYWIGKRFWGQGYATEALQAIIDYGFIQHKLNKVYASYFARNPASGRVMEKAGMVYEGIARAHYMRWGKYEDSVSYGILRAEWEEAQP